MTLREHALRMTAQPLWLYLALDIVLGPQGGRADRSVDGDVLARGAGARASTPASAGTAAGRRGQVELVHADPAARLLLVPPRARRRSSSLVGRRRRARDLRAGAGARRDRAGRACRSASSSRCGGWWPGSSAASSCTPGCSPTTSSRTATRTSCCARRGRSRTWCSGIGVALGSPGRDAKGVRARRGGAGRGAAACLMKIGFVAHQQNGAADRVLLAGVGGRHGGAVAPRRGDVRRHALAGG